MKRSPLRRNPESTREWLRKNQRKSAEWARNNRSRLDRKKGLNRRNVERLHRKRGGGPDDPERHTYGAYWRFASGLPCCICGVTDGAPADHWDTVGAGGRDRRNCLPVCAEHQDRHGMPREEWAERYNVDVEAMLEEVERAWRRHCAR